MLQYLGERLDAMWLDELVHRKLINRYPSGELPIAGRRGLPDRLGGRPVCPEPLSRPPVQVRYQFWGFALQLQAQNLGEQRVIAVPAATHGLDESIGQGERRKGGGGLLTGELAGQFDIDALKNARAQEEGSHAGRQGIEHLRGQVARDSTVLGGELFDELARVGVMLHRDRGQTQGRHPPGRPVVEERQRFCTQPHAVVLHQQPGFIDGEREVVGVDLGQLAGQPVAVQRQERIAAGCYDDAQGWLCVPEQLG